MAGDDMTLRAAGKDDVLTPAELPSGTKYVAAAAAAETSFVSDGEGGVLMVEGVEFPGCVKVGRAAAEPAVVEPAAPWAARGQEPFWSIAIDPSEIVLTYDLGAQTYRTATPAPEAIDGGRRYKGDPPVLVVTALTKTCFDSMSGLPYPEQVSVQYGEQAFKGCGGDPQVLLAGDEWVVEDVNGAGAPDGARLTLGLGTAKGRVNGGSGCNTYGATYSVCGDGMQIGPVMTYEKACPPVLMDIEQKFQTALGAANAYTDDETGALVLTGPGSARILARQ